MTVNRELHMAAKLVAEQRARCISTVKVTYGVLSQPSTTPRDIDPHLERLTVEICNLLQLKAEYQSMKQQAESAGEEVPKLTE